MFPTVVWLLQQQVLNGVLNDGGLSSTNNTGRLSQVWDATATRISVNYTAS